jgi:hypothetical protein
MTTSQFTILILMSLWPLAIIGALGLLLTVKDMIHYATTYGIHLYKQVTRHERRKSGGTGGPRDGHVIP